MIMKYVSSYQSKQHLHTKVVIIVTLKIPVFYQYASGQLNFLNEADTGNI